VLTDGFFHDGTWSSFRGRHHGVALDRGRTHAWRLVVSTQNHDQIGNRARGPVTVLIHGGDGWAEVELARGAAPLLVTEDRVHVQDGRVRLGPWGVAVLGTGFTPDVPGEGATPAM
jgi:hypothetical protein